MTLREAMAGTSADRLAFCISKAISKHAVRFALFGYSSVDIQRQSYLAMWWFLRLERLADK